MNQRTFVLSAMLILALVGTSCQPQASPTPDTSSTRTAVALARSLWTPVPVVTALPSETPTATATETATVTPTLTFTPSSTPTDAPTPTPRIVIVTNTPRVSSTPAESAPVTAASNTLEVPTVAPEATRPPFKEHFIFQRPFADNLVTYWARNYSFGSTEGGKRKVHRGVDIMNPAGTPVLAAAEGDVYFAGPDIDRVFGSQPDFYGNVIVIKHPFTDAAGQDVYSLYGHLSQITVVTGQHVKAGDMIGRVGQTGIAIGPHLHFEVRLAAPENYDATYNPEMWIIPYPNHGVLAGRVVDSKGKAMENVLVEVRKLSTGDYFSGYTYTGTGVKSDAALNENFAIGDLPAGDYNVFINLPNEGLVFRRVLTIQADKTTWVDIQIKL